jgi:negative regulator of flagellin synthesis FlgM
MKVNSSAGSPVQAGEAKKNGKAEKAEKAAGAQKNEKAEATAKARTEVEGSVNAKLSTKGREMSQAKEIASKTPDVREEKIAALKARIAGGKYAVDAEAVADRMVDEHLEMSGIG